MGMISFEHAFEIVMGSLKKTGTEQVPFTSSLNRILAEAVTSDMNLPPFDKATVDGFACRRSDLGSELRILETIAAGTMPQLEIHPGTCSRIMTGAPIPHGADIVFMVEDSVLLEGEKVRFSGNFSKDNISRKGEDIVCGDIVLLPGTRIRAQEIAVLATVGATTVTVGKRPLVGVISSGDELAEPYEKPSPAGIRNSNAYQLMAQIETVGGQGRYMGIVKDDRDITAACLREAFGSCNIVLITGGVSMGDFDFIPSVMKDLGVKILFDAVRIQPGKPTTFGIKDDIVVFGLPGNPVSSFVQFELLVKPYIYAVMGHDFSPPRQNMKCATAYTRRSSDRLGFVPVSVNDRGEASVVEYHGSAHISALSRASGLIEMKPGQTTIEKGDLISVRQI
jgi:molybdopterin molybdotransferase